MARLDIPPGEGDDLYRMFELAPELGMAAAQLSGAVYASTKLPVRLRELMRMRIANINQCFI